MKIDIIRKAPVDMVSIIFRRKWGIGQGITTAKHCQARSIARAKISFAYGDIKNFALVNGNPTPKHYFIRCRQ